MNFTAHTNEIFPTTQRKIADLQSEDVILASFDLSFNPEIPMRFIHARPIDGTSEVEVLLGTGWESITIRTDLESECEFIGNSREISQLV